MALTFIDEFFFKEQSFNIKNFDLEKLSEQMTSIYKSEGFETKTVKKENSYVIDIEKNMDGANFFFGGQQSLTAKISYDNDVLNIEYSNGAWIGKIIGIGFGVILCYVPTVMSILGTIKQVKLYKETRLFVENCVNNQ